MPNPTEEDVRRAVEEYLKRGKTIRRLEDAPPPPSTILLEHDAQADQELLKIYKGIQQNKGEQ